MRIVLFLVLSSVLLVSLSAQSSTQYSKVKIHLHAEDDLKKVSSLGLECDHGIHAAHKYLINVYSQAELVILTDAGLHYEVLIEDVNAFYDQYGTSDHRYAMAAARGTDCLLSDVDLFDYETPANYTYGSMGGYLTYAQALAEMDKMAELYPQLISDRDSIGDIVTHEGRRLYYMSISNSPNNIDPQKPQVLYNSLHHAREPNSLSQNIFYMWYLLENYGTDPEVTYLVDNVTMFFFPIVNPDGYVYNERTNPNGGGFWRKNRYVNTQGDTVGVDLNRNYGYFWGFDDIGSSTDEFNQTYRGTEAFSEPETQAMRQLFIDNRFEIVLNYHTFGNLLIHPWGYSDEPTDEDILFKSLGGVMAADNEYLLGTGTETVGYTVNGDSDDWMYGEENEKIKAYSMTPEVGPAFWPAQSQIDGLNKQALRMNLNAAHLLLSFGWAKEIDPQRELEALSGTLEFELEKSGLRDGLLSFSVISETPGVSLSNNVYNDLNMAAAEKMNFEVGYIIDPSFSGANIEFTSVVDNGDYQHRKTINKIFTINRLEPAESIIDSVMEAANYSFTAEWGLTTEDFVSPPFSLTDSPNSRYSDNTDSELVLLNGIDLMDADSAYLHFATKFQIEADYDYVQLLASTDGVVYVPLCGKFSEAAVLDQLPDASPVYDGSLDDWSQERICLNEFIGEEVLLRFDFHSDGAVTRDGFYIDDIVVDIYKETSSVEQTITLSNVLILPNPTQDFIDIIINDEGVLSDLNFEITDALGKKILGGRLDGQSKRIGVANFIEGVYFLQISSNGSLISTTKFIKG